ncbi:hypothetical protein [Alistipes putredinis]|uniref:hypothetical protein n=1 Tax=Alistipes putredinis TaxID=28117 RepID=UPI003A928C79
MKHSKACLNRQIDRLEAEFEKNRAEMTSLRAKRQSCTSRYDELLAANRRIDDEIRATLKELWECAD